MSQRDTKNQGPGRTAENPHAYAPRAQGRLHLDDEPSAPGGGKKRKGTGQRDQKVSKERMIINLLKLGMSQRNAARACEIRPEVLSRWKTSDEEFKLRVDAALMQACGSKLRILHDLSENAKQESVRFQAVRFWLTSRIPEFRERVHVVDEEDYDPDESFL